MPPRWEIIVELDRTDFGELLISGEYNLFKPATEDHPELSLKLKLKNFPTEEELVGAIKKW